MNFVYVGIGSCPHVSPNSDVRELNQEWDQILPKFVKDLILSNIPIQIYHFDPMFYLYTPFLSRYAEYNGLHEIDSKEVSVFLASSEQVKMNIYSEKIEHDRLLHESDKFPESTILSLISQCLDDPGRKLVLQEFTGRETTNLFIKM